MKYMNGCGKFSKNRYVKEGVLFMAKGRLVSVNGSGGKFYFLNITILDELNKDSRKAVVTTALSKSRRENVSMAKCLLQMRR